MYWMPSHGRYFLADKYQSKGLDAGKPVRSKIREMVVSPIINYEDNGSSLRDEQQRRTPLEDARDVRKRVVYCFIMHVSLEKFFAKVF